MDIYDIISQYKRKNKTDTLRLIPIYQNNRLEGYLRPVTFDFEQSMSGIVSDLSLWRKENPTASNSTFVVTDERTKNWVYRDVLNKQDRIVFIIVNLKHEHIGQMGLANFDIEEHSAELDLVIRGRKDVKKGIMSDALTMLIQWGRRELMLDSIYLDVFSDNAHAIAFYRKNGFVECGRTALIRVQYDNEIKWEKSDSIDVDKAERCSIKMQYVCGGGRSKNISGFNVKGRHQIANEELQELDWRACGMRKLFGVFACGEIGRLAVRLFLNHKERLKFVVLDTENFWGWNKKIEAELADFKETKIIYYKNDDELLPLCKSVDAAILAFWGGIIRDELLEAPRFGYINLHASLLPYGKGKHAHYWSIVEGMPYGVTIMKIDKGLDTGKIIFQKEIEVLWSDTGKSLYFKAYQAMAELLEEKRDQILNLQFALQEQRDKGTFHYGKEIEDSSHIILDKDYTARNLLNILRARSFKPFPAAYFYENGKKYEVTVQISEAEEEFSKDELDYEKLMKDARSYFKQK